MRILFVQKVKGLAGSENYLLNIMPELKKRGIEVELLMVCAATDQKQVALVSQPLQASNIKVHEIVSDNDLSYGLIRSIHQLIKKGKYDIVNSQLIHADFWCSLVKRFFQPSMVLVSGKHGYDEIFTNKYGFNSEKRLRNKYYWTLFAAEKNINRSFAVSKGLQNLLIQNGICQKDKIDLIYYGFNNHFREDKKEANTRFSPQQMIIVGRLTAYKGHRFVIEALHQLRDKYPDLKLVIVGTGPNKENLEAQIKALNLTDKVIFTGFRTDVLTLFAHSDIALVPSVSEGFGFVFAEAFEVKTPVIAFDVPAGNELIQDGHSGFLIPPFDITILAQKITSLLEQPQLGQDMADNAYQRLKSYFTFERMTDETIAFYQKALTGIKGGKI